MKRPVLTRAGSSVILRADRSTTETHNGNLLLRRNTDQATVGWEVDLPAADHARFEELIPVKGAFVAVVTIGLRVLLDQLEKEPQLQVWAHEDIRRHLYGEVKPHRPRALSVRIPTPLYTRFNALLPEWGATSWFVRGLIKAVNNEVQESSLPKHVEAAIMRVLEQPSAITIPTE